jgi:hypothetical protein
MGKGAFVAISNQSTLTVSISYSDISCMQEDGSSGSDFRPISGTVAAGGARGNQYIEASAGPFCLFSTSTFTMNIRGPAGTVAVPFTEKSQVYAVASGFITGPGLSATTTVNLLRDQYFISVTIRDHEFGTATWMAESASFIADRKLAEIVLPGTHDSGTYAINGLSLIAPGQDPSKWIDVLRSVSLLPGFIVGNVIANWARTQPIDISGQLAAGIRYLDLRVVQTDTFWICHGMFSVVLADVIRQVKAFVDVHPQEIIILDFNHFFEIRDQPALVRMLTDAFGTKLAPGTLTPASKVSDFWQQGHSVIALYANQAVVDAHPRQLWSQDRISSPYPDRQDLQALHNDLDTALALRDKNQLFVLQGILTPNATVVSAGLNPGSSPNSIETLAAKVTPAVVGWVKDWANRDLNIVIVDWFTVAPAYVETLVRINLRHASS